MLLLNTGCVGRGGGVARQGTDHYKISLISASQITVVTIVFLFFSGMKIILLSM